MPLTIVALTVTVPTAVVLSVFPLIVAPVVPALTMLHAIVLFVALDGFIVPVSVSCVPAVAVVGTPVMLVTGVCPAACVTEIVLVTIALPVPDVTVTVPVLKALPVLAVAEIVNEPLPVRLAGVTFDIVSHVWLLVGAFHAVLDVIVTVVFDATDGGDHVVGLRVSVPPITVIVKSCV